MSLEIPLIIAQDFTPENLIIGLVAFAVALTIHAEAQAFVANLLHYDEIAREKRFFSFNPFAHLDPFALAAFIFCGFGWPRRIAPLLKPKKTKHLILIQLAGPAANLLLANIIGSIILVLGKLDAGLMDEKAINVLMATNVTFAIYNLLLPLPPLTLGNLVSRLFTPEKRETAAYTAGLVVIFAIFLFEFITGGTLISGTINGAVREVFFFLKP